MIRSTLTLLLAISITVSMAQKYPKKDPFRHEWTKIDSLTDRGLPQSAAKIARQIQSAAKQRGDNPNAIKATLFLMATEAVNQENAEIRHIHQADSMITVSEGPEKALWQSIAAERYWQYYQRNRWTILNRTPLMGEPPADIATWDAATLIAKASDLYQAAIHHSELLKVIPVERYAPLLLEGKNTRNLRPTLYDFLAFRAIDFFKNDEKDIIKPAYQFQIDGILWFDPADRFAEVMVNPKDPGSLHFRALHTYQQVLRFHLNDKQPDALIDADLQRLAFVQRYSVHPKKDSLYLRALQNLATTYPNTPAAAEATYRSLQFHYDRHLSDQDTIDLIQLKRQLDALIERFPDSEGAVHAAELRYALTSKSIDVQAEEVVLPEENSKVLLRYRNLSKVHLRIYRIPVYWDNRQRSLDQAEQENILMGKPLRQWESALPGSDDLREHRTELKINPLPAGHYLLVVSAKPTFTADENVIHATPLQVSALSVVTQRSAQGTSIIALHRKSGMPIRGAQAMFWENRWDSKRRDYEYIELGQSRTDEDGIAQLVPKKDKSLRINRITLVSGGDTLVTDGYFTTSAHQDDKHPDTEKHTFLFTDRAIYRPGQTIYFKGILVEHRLDGKGNTVLANEKTKVTLYDVNGQAITTLDLVSNAYGSFSGQFTAPSGGLTGQMRIEGDEGYTTISVEEYKRPKFEVVFDTVKATVGLNEEVIVNGRAQAYAGHSIDGAEVRYRVIRRSRFPYFWAYYHWGQPSSPEMEIINGTATTDTDGLFEVRFTTTPDPKINAETSPVFTYTVYADVTDINGETQSNSHQVNAGYRTLEITTDIPEQLDATKVHKLALHTKDLNGVTTQADVSVTVAPLQFPGKLYRARYWEKPDQYLMTEAEFRTAFPDDEYGDEADYLNWPAEAAVWDTTINTGRQQAVFLPASIWKKQGWHLITFSTSDPQGNRITEKKYIYAIDPKTHARPQTPLLVHADSLSLEPGQQLALTIKTGYDNTYVLERNAGLGIEFSTFSESRSVTRTITEDDRGGVGFNWLFVYNNRAYSASRHIAVPWTNRDLQLEWATHRDKLLPGEQEEWQLTIKGDKKDAVTSELLAGLYDASLDALKPHLWRWDKLSPTRHLDVVWALQHGFGQTQGTDWQHTINGKRPPGFTKVYDRLITYLPPGYDRPYLAVSSAARKSANTQAVEESAVVNYAADEAEGGQTADGDEIAGVDVQPPPRANFQETAFFFPHLQTDAKGDVTFKFTMPEALTEWKLMAFAHTPDWKTGYLEGKIKTQKDLMVMPNLPRFLRQGDDIRLSAKVSNISSEALRGTAHIELLDATTLQPLSGVDAGLGDQAFVISQHQSTDVAWIFSVPDSLFDPIAIRISAKAGNFTDGEETTVPVITNRILVTETLPLPVRGNEHKTFTLDKLANTTSDTRESHALTVAFTGNPAWYAVQALPYLMEYPYECAEQVFGQVYANALAAHIVHRAPRVKAIFEQWKNSDTSALLSNLEKNRELKAALLEETPWVIDAKNEREQKHRIARLFQSQKLAEGLQQNLAKLAEMQLTDGSFPWFKGMASNRYITQYIATGIARLQRLGVEAAASETAIHILTQAVDYLDRQMKADHDRLVKDNADLSKQQLGYTQVHYLYMRSLVEKLQIHPESRAAYDFYMGQAAKFWNVFNPYLKGQLALALHRAGKTEPAAAIMASLRETAVHNDELGMYWKTMPRGYRWYEAPVEAQALLVEAFAEVASDLKAVDDLKVWLIKQKQTQHWNTTKATADAIYALLLQGSDWLVNEPEVTITLGRETIQSTDIETEAATGYFKKRFDGNEVTADMGNISVNVAKAQHEGVAWGAVYWQYFEDLDKITGAETPLSLRKQLYIQRNTDRGPVLEEINADNPLQVGDKVTVRVELRVDRDMEYVHLKDMRAACFEPINVLSGHRYQGGLGYYESTRDAATNFFFDYLRKGSYVFEYPVFVAQAGDFSNGISTIQCLYAPEFSSRSEGIRVQVDE